MQNNHERTYCVQDRLVACVWLICWARTDAVRVETRAGLRDTACNKPSCATYTHNNSNDKINATNHNTHSHASTRGVSIVWVKGSAPLCTPIRCCAAFSNCSTIHTVIHHATKIPSMTIINNDKEKKILQTLVPELHCDTLHKHPSRQTDT